MRVEGGAANLTLASLVAVADGLDVGVEALFKAHPEADAPGAATPSATTPSS